MLFGNARSRIQAHILTQLRIISHILFFGAGVLVVAFLVLVQAVVFVTRPLEFDVVVFLLIDIIWRFWANEVQRFLRRPATCVRTYLYVRRWCVFVCCMNLCERMVLDEHLARHLIYK